MLLMERETGHLIEVLDPAEVYDPFKSEFTGRLSIGEDVADPATFEKKFVIFMSGENLPKCWTDPKYRD